MIWNLMSLLEAFRFYFFIEVKGKRFIGLEEKVEYLGF